MAAVMASVQNNVVVWFGLLCSSFTRVNQGTSKRSYLVPLGDTTKTSVINSNILAARSLSPNWQAYLLNVVHLHTTSNRPSLLQKGKESWSFNRFTQ